MGPRVGPVRCNPGAERPARHLPGGMTGTARAATEAPMTAITNRPAATWNLGRALAHPNYRLFFVGQGVSLIGTWMTRLATGWLVYRLGGDHAAFLLGVVG